MTLEFIEQNGIVERYLSGKLPRKGALDFERFCRDNPSLLDGLGLAARINAGLHLLEASGKPEPWQQPEPKLWQKPQVAAGVAAAAVVFAVLAAVLGGKLTDRNKQVAALTQRVAERPLEPSTGKRPIVLIPSRTGPSSRPAVTIGASRVELAEFKIDLSWSRFSAFRVTINRQGQGLVGIVHNLLKDSNGHLRLSLNSSALGPGEYAFTIESLNMRGHTEPVAWATIGIAPTP